VIKRFRYIVVTAIVRDERIVMAVAHTSRKPLLAGPLEVAGSDLGDARIVASTCGSVPEIRALCKES
jgi:hypothetical protein